MKTSSISSSSYSESGESIATIPNQILSRHIDNLKDLKSWCKQHGSYNFIVEYSLPQEMWMFTLLFVGGCVKKEIRARYFLSLCKQIQSYTNFLHSKEAFEDVSRSPLCPT